MCDANYLQTKLNEEESKITITKTIKKRQRKYNKTKKINIDI